MISLRLLAIGFLSTSLLLQDDSCMVVAFHNHHNGIAQRNKKCNFSINKNKMWSKSFPSQEKMAPRIPGGVGVLKALPLIEDPASILQSSDVWVFLLGVFPFAWATVEFWRRIMFGESFGTGSDQVIIGMEDSPADSRGRRVLGRGALGTAYFLFAASFATLAVVLYAVISSAPPPDVLPVPNAGDVVIPGVESLQ
mmetsp:Transcript_8593/g.20691  ORF Transcript_8593/g.20691 Transcript_8593/m.20691 type:complete len:196 (-) Transcript_8593:52-639(-)